MVYLHVSANDTISVHYHQIVQREHVQGSCCPVWLMQQGNSCTLCYPRYALFAADKYIHTMIVKVYYEKHMVESMKAGGFMPSNTIHTCL